jgi:PAS domain S-box-containing protein
MAKAGRWGILCLVVCIWMHVHAAEPLCVQGDWNYPPYEYIDEDGTPTGFNVDLFDAIAEVTGLHYKLELKPWNEARSSLENGTCDVITGMYYSEARAKSVDFSVPHTLVSHVIFVQKNARFKHVKDLRNARIAIQKHDIMHDKLIEMGLSANIMEVEDQKQAVLALSRGLCDAAFVSNLQAHYFIRLHKLKNLRILDDFFEPQKYCIAVKKGDQQLLQTINEGLNIIQENGTYKRIYDKWFTLIERSFFWARIKVYVFGVCTLVLLAFIWVMSMRRQVVRRTLQLNREIQERQKAEQELLEQRNLLRTIIQDSPLGISVRNAKGQLIVHNSAWKRIWGISEEKLLQYYEVRNTLMFDERDSYLGTYLPQVKAVYQNGGSTFIPKLKLRNATPGKAEWISQHFYALQNDDGHISQVVIITEDITQRVHIEERIKEHQETFRLFYSYAPVGYVSMDASGLIKSTNQAWEELSGYSADAIINRPIMDFVVPEQRIKLQRELLMMQDVHTIRDIEFEIMMANGKTCSVSMNCNLAHEESFQPTIHAVFFDISRRKRYEQQLKIHRENLEQIIDSIVVGIFITDQQGTIIKINDSAVRMAGYDSKYEIIGHQCTTVFCPENKESCPYREQQKTLINEERTLLRKDGTTIPILKSAVPITYNNQRVLLESFSDISLLKSIQERITQSLKEKEILLQEIHHRVKNNMQVISSLLKMQSRYLINDEDKALFLDSQNRVKTMALIHEKLYGSSNFSEVDLKPYLRTLVGQLQRSYQQDGQYISTVVQVGDVSLSITQAIPCGLLCNEIYSNALKHAFIGRTRGRIEISLSQQNNEISLIISDDGIGYTQTRNTEDLDSLGLRLIESLVSQLHGTLNITSEEGTTFTITFTKQ